MNAGRSTRTAEAMAKARAQLVQRRKANKAMRQRAARKEVRRILNALHAARFAVERGMVSQEDERLLGHEEMDPPTADQVEHARAWLLAIQRVVERHPDYRDAVDEWINKR